MKKRTLLRGSLLLLMALIGLSSCVKEATGDTDRKDNQEAMVTFALDVPGISNPATRSLTVADESNVTEIDVLLFKSGVFYQSYEADMIDYVIKKQFTVTLPFGTFDIVVFANSRASIAAAKTAGKMVNKTTPKNNALDALLVSQTGKWISNRIPMWGYRNGVLIDENTDLTGPAKSIKMSRMLSKIEVQLAPAAAGTNNDNFAITSVYVYNYNTAGKVAATSGWNDAGYIATAPDLPAAPGKMAGKANKLSFTAADDLSGLLFTPSAVLNTIYTFEADGQDAGQLDRICVVVGGSYKNSGDDTNFYRMDFVKPDKSFFDLLRNFKYTFTVKTITGEGFFTPDDAFEAGPMNIETEVLNWNEGDVNTDFNGQYYVHYTSRTVNFSQFGVALDANEITIKTNAPTLTVDQIVNVAAEAGESTWSESPSGTWKNTHFTVVFSSLGVIGSDNVYKIVVSCLPGISGEEQRESTITLQAANLNSTIGLVQNKPIQYSIETNPSGEYPVAVDGSARFYKIDVQSTHNYVVDFQDANTPKMFTGVYADAAGATLLSTGADGNVIPIATRKTVYLKLNAYADVPPKIASAEFSHAPALGSTALAVKHLLIQVEKQIKAGVGVLGVTAGTLPKAGGTINLVVNSNLLAWKPVMTLNGTPVPDANLSTYFNITQGSGSATEVLTLGANPTQTPRIITVYFVDTTDPLMKSPTLTITHKGSAGIPANPLWTDVLSYDPVAGLNLDGLGEVVLFKWGSLIGLSSDATLRDYDTGDAALRNDIIAYRPAGYTGVQTPTTYEAIPYGDATGFPSTFPAQNKLTGRGDPCQLITSKGGSAVAEGAYKMPTGNPFQGFATTGNIGNNTEQGNVTKYLFNTNGGASLTNIATGTFTLKNEAAVLYGATMVLPAAGTRNSGGVINQGTYGYYWSSTVSATNAAYNLGFGSSNANPSNYTTRGYGFAVRCVQ